MVEMARICLAKSGLAAATMRPGARVPSSGGIVGKSESRKLTEGQVKCVFNFDADEVLDVCKLARSGAAEGMDSVSSTSQYLSPPAVSLWTAEDRIKLKQGNLVASDTFSNTDLVEKEDVIDIFRRLQAAKRPALVSEPLKGPSAAAPSDDLPLTVGRKTNIPVDDVATKPPALPDNSELLRMREAALKAIQGKKRKSVSMSPAPFLSSPAKEERELTEKELTTSAATASGRKRSLATVVSEPEKEEGEVSDSELAPVEPLLALRDAALQAVAGRKKKRKLLVSEVLPPVDKEEGELTDEEVSAGPSPMQNTLAAMREAALQALGNRLKNKALETSCQTSLIDRTDCLAATDDITTNEKKELSDKDAPVGAPTDQIAAMRQAALDALKGKKIKTLNSEVDKPCAPVRTSVDKEEGELSDEEGAVVVETVESRNARLAAMRATALQLVKARPKAPMMVQRKESYRGEEIYVQLLAYLDQKKDPRPQLLIPPPLPKFLYANSTDCMRKAISNGKVGKFRCSWCGIPEINIAKGRFYGNKMSFNSLLTLAQHVRVVHPSGKPKDMTGGRYVFYSEFNSLEEYDSQPEHPLYAAIVKSLASSLDLSEAIRANTLLINNACKASDPGISGRQDIDTAVNAIAAEEFLSSLGMGLDRVIGPAAQPTNDFSKAMDLDVLHATMDAVGDPLLDIDISVHDEGCRYDGTNEVVMYNEGEVNGSDTEPDEPAILNNSIPAAKACQNIKTAESPSLSTAGTGDLAGPSVNRNGVDRAAEISRLLEREADLKLALKTQKYKEEIKAAEKLFLYQGNKIADLRSLLGRLQQAEHEQSELVDNLRKDRATLLQRAAKVDFTKVELLSELASTRLQMHLMEKSQKTICDVENKLGNTFKKSSKC